jgi:hypothetical protein
VSRHALGDPLSFFSPPSARPPRHLVPLAILSRLSKDSDCSFRRSVASNSLMCTPATPTNPSASLLVSSLPLSTSVLRSSLSLSLFFLTDQSIRLIPSLLRSSHRPNATTETPSPSLRPAQA